MHGYCDIEDGEQAHTDRATLLRLLDAAREELREVKEAAGRLKDLDYGWHLRPGDDELIRLSRLEYASPFVTNVSYGDLRRLAAALKKRP